MSGNWFAWFSEVAALMPRKRWASPRWGHTIFDARMNLLQ
jgi:hypothetical protein